MNTKLGPSNQESSILAVSSAGATASSSTAPLPRHLLQQKDCRVKDQAAGAFQPVATTIVLHHTPEENDSSLSRSDNLDINVVQNNIKRQREFHSDFSDSQEDSGEDTDATAVDSDTGSFYSVGSRLTRSGHSSQVSLQDPDYFSESTFYNSAQSLLTPTPSIHSSFLSITSYETLDGNSSSTDNFQSSFSFQSDSSDHRRGSDISVDYTSCPDLSIGSRRGRGQGSPSRPSPIQTSTPFFNGYLPKSQPVRNRTVSTSSMSAIDGSPVARVADEFETKKKKGLMSSFRKSRKTGRKLRQQKKAANDGDSISTSTGVTSDGEQELFFDSEASAPNSPAPVKNQVFSHGSSELDNAFDKQDETVLDSHQATHERLNGTTSKDSSQPNSINASPAMGKSNKISEGIKKFEEKEEKKSGKSKFGGSIFRKKKTELSSTAQQAAADDTADVVASETPEVKEDEKGDELKTEPEPETTDDTQSAQSAEVSATEEPSKPGEAKTSSFRSYISNVQFVKNWTVSSEAPKAQQISETVPKTGLDVDTVDGGKAVESTGSAPRETATTTTETKKITTSSANGKPSTTEVTSKKKTTVTIVTKQSPKLRNSPTNVVRQAKALVSPQSPSSVSPKTNKKSATVNTQFNSQSRRSKSPSPTLPKRPPLEMVPPLPTTNPQSLLNKSGSSPPIRQPSPPLTVSTATADNRKQAKPMTINQSVFPQRTSIVDSKGQVSESPPTKKVQPIVSSLNKSAFMSDSQQSKKIAVTEPLQSKGKTMTSMTEGPKKSTYETQQPKKTNVKESPPINQKYEPPKVPRISVTEHSSSQSAPMVEPQQPKKVSATQPQHPKKMYSTEPEHSKRVAVVDPLQLKKVTESESQPSPKNISVSQPTPPFRISDNEPQHPKKVPINNSKTRKGSSSTDEAATTPTPMVPIPASTTPSRATPPSSPEGHPEGDARETPEGDRTEHEQRGLLESSGLTDSWAGSSSDKREHLYKILVIGELGTGKTSIIKRYVHQFFSQHYRATIGVDFALKVLNWDNNTVIRLQLWDIAGQERFGNMTRVYYKEAVGAFVVFDVTRAQTFDAVTKWKTDLDTKVTLADGSPIPTVLLANKCDQPKEGVVNNPARMDDYCRERGFSGWFETSAKENINIDEASRFLVNKILNNEKQGMMMTESLDTDKFSVDGKVNPVDRSGCRC